MSERVSSLALTLFLLVLLAAMTWMAVGFNVQARRVPLVVGIPTTIGLAIQLLRELLAFRLGSEVSDAKAGDDSDPVKLPEGVGPDVSEEAEAASSTRTERAQVPDPKASAVQAFGWVLALGFSFYLFGMLATVPLFVGSFMRFYGGESWKIVLASVAGTMGVLYLFFVRLLEVRLYSGTLFEWLGL